jgi:hypothetical protein
VPADVRPAPVVSAAPAVRRRAAPAPRRERSDRLRRHGPVLLAALLACAYLVWQPVSADLAAAEYRAALFGDHGFAVWDLQWYAGHHLPGYSVTVPALSFLLGPRLLGALAAVAATALFERLARARYGERAWVGATWFALGSATSLLSGRITFAAGLVPALAALVLLQRGGGRGARAAVLALGVATALTSPVAALFLALAGTAVALTDAGRRRDGASLAAAALLPVLALSVAFPEGGTEPFPLKACAETVLFAAVVLMLLPLRERTLRAGTFLYALGCVAAYVVPTPVGSNVVRLGALCAGPVLALAMARERRSRLVALALIAPLLLSWQWRAAISDVRSAAGDPATHARYYRPLLRALAAQQADAAPGARLEIPFTRQHWEARWVAPHVPLARGWERQVDRADNAVFYSGTLTAARYRAWLRDNAVAWVAVPRHTTLDYSAQPEARLVTHGLPYLRPVWHDARWTLYAVRDATPLSSGAARVTAAHDTTLTLHATRPGDVRLRVRWTPYWAVTSGAACVAPDGPWTRLHVTRPGALTLGVRFTPTRIHARSARCHA